MPICFVKLTEFIVSIFSLFLDGKAMVFGGQLVFKKKLIMIDEDLKKIMFSKYTG